MTCEQPYYSTEIGSLFKGDCINIMDQLINKGLTFDAIITDPPYSITGYKWDKIIPFDEMWERLDKLIKPNGAIILFGNEPFSSDLRNSNKDYYRYDWKWLKTQVTGYQNAKFQPLRCYEDVMVFSKSGAISSCNNPMCYYPQGLIEYNKKVIGKSVDYVKEKKNNQKFEYIQEYKNYPRNVIQFARETNLYHPTQKPCSLMEYLIQTYTKENELVLDFTSGSGSTLLACEILNRRWVGIEITEKYCEVIKRRLENGLQLKLSFESFENKKEEC